MGSLPVDADTHPSPRIALHHRFSHNNMQEKNFAAASLCRHIFYFSRLFSIDIRRPGCYHSPETKEESKVKPQAGYFVHRLIAQADTF